MAHGIKGCNESSLFKYFCKAEQSNYQNHLIQHKIFSYTSMKKRTNLAQERGSHPLPLSSSTRE